MTDERTTPAETTGVQGTPSFPVPRNRPVLTIPEEHDDHEEEGMPPWQRWALVALLVLSLGGAITLIWLVSRPAEKPPPPPVEAARIPTDDPAVEIYFAPSKPRALPPLEEDPTPLPVSPVSLDDLFGKDER